MNWEQEPDPTSVIDLHPTEKDVFKDQRTALDWKFSQRDFNTAIDGAKMVGEELRDDDPPGVRIAPSDSDD